MLFVGVIFLAAENKPAISSVPEKQCNLHEIQKVDQIAIKQREMRDPIVRVETRQALGSGTIYEKLDTGTKNLFEYRVLTNQHVTQTRMMFPSDADFLTGKLIILPIDTGCSIDVFDHKNQKQKRYVVKVVAENPYLDLAILSFETDDPITVALLATDEILESIRVFDNVFALGCQLGMRPTPTFGIISDIISGVTRQVKWMLYGTTSQIASGSSGGGLFVEYDGHYYLIGIILRAAVTRDHHIMPHLANAISLSTAKNFLEENRVSKE